MQAQHTALVPVLAGTLLLSLGAASFAQSPPTPNTAPPPTANTIRDPKACAPSQQVTPPGATTGQSPNQNSGQSLGDKLAQTDGVLCPPSGMDPEIHAPAPDVGTMPVIPPPGSPGGDPTVRPK